MALGQLRGPSWLTGTLLAAPIRPLFSRMRGVSVCNGHHGWNVMKKVKGPAQAKLGRATLRGQMAAIGWASPPPAV